MDNTTFTATLRSKTNEYKDIFIVIFRSIHVFSAGFFSMIFTRLFGELSALGCKTENASWVSLSRLELKDERSVSFSLQLLKNFDWCDL